MVQVGSGKEREALGAGQGTAVAALLTAALVWGLIWFPYRVLREGGVGGLPACTLTYLTALLFGLLAWRRQWRQWRWSAQLLWLALASAGCNLGYVLATLSGEVVRVLLLFYLAPLWTVLLARLLLDERLSRAGGAIVLLALGGALTLLWPAGEGWAALPWPRDMADWLGLGAGFSFALFNVLSRRAATVPLPQKAVTAFAGAALVGLLLSVGAGFWPSFWPNAWPTTWPAWPLPGLLLLLGGVLVAANLLAQYGLAQLPANRAIVIMLTEVGFAALSAWLLAGETMGPQEWLGGAMILAASVFSARIESA